MKAVVLARVSRGERSQDPASQVEALRGAAQRKGWEVVEVVEQVCSAWDQKAAAKVREAALAPIRAGKADVLMVWALDRLLREGALAALLFLRQLEEHYGAQLFSLQEPFLSTASDPATREMLLPTIAWVGKWESQRKSERLQTKAAFKRQAAEKVGQRARWGRGSMATGADKARILELVGSMSQRKIAEEVGLSVGSVNAIIKEARS